MSVFKPHRALTELLEARRLLSATTETLAVGNALYTATESGIYSGGSDLFRSNLDGTGQQLLGHWQSGFDGPHNLFAYGSKLLFAADYQNNAVTGSELWVSDGSASGTTLVADLYQSSAGSYPRNFALVNGTAVFLANNNSPDQTDLYTTDGTTAGTRLLSPFQADGFSSAVTNLQFGATAVTWDQFNDSTNHTEHLSSDGTTYQVLYANSVNEIAQIGTVDYSPHTIAVSQADGYLSVTDTEHFDDHDFTTSYRFRSQDVTGISISGSTRSDSITLAASVTQSATILGNLGDDTITDLGSGTDSIDGGDGADTITANSSQDSIVADANDTVIDSANSNPSGGDTTGSSGGDDGSGSTPVVTPIVLPAPTPSYSLHLGVLRINGASGDDTLKLMSGGNSIKLLLDGTSSKVLRASVDSIIVYGGAGDDSILLGNLAIKSRLYGQAGNDSITGSLGKDRIYGGDGDDVIDGGDNRDTIYGQAGNDHLFGGSGSDDIFAGTGRNVIRGEGGVDHITYAAGDDVRGNRGDVMDVDSIVG